MYQGLGLWQVFDIALLEHRLVVAGRERRDVVDNVHPLEVTVPRVRHLVVADAGLVLEDAPDRPVQPLAPRAVGALGVHGPGVHAAQPVVEVLVRGKRGGGLAQESGVGQRHGVSPVVDGFLGGRRGRASRRGQRSSLPSLLHG